MQVFATSPAAVYTGIGNAFTRISSTEGVRVLWRGVSSVIMGAGPAHAVHFGTYEAIKELTGGNREGSPNQWLSARESFLRTRSPLDGAGSVRTNVGLGGLLAFAGASATIASDALMNPFDGGLIPPMCYQSSPSPPQS
jgi:solute carrier family 25 (mitochondrial iron transporter), member 28/37